LDGFAISKENPLFNWSDAWLLLAVAFASQRGAATLETIIAAGDGINFAIFNADELESGLVRLTESGYIVENGGSFSLTEKVKPHSDSFLAKQRSMDKRLRNVQEMLGAASAPDDQPCKDNLKYPGFAKNQYEEAVLHYQGYVRGS
jgi:hypothetical protein